LHYDESKDNKTVDMAVTQKPKCMPLVHRALNTGLKIHVDRASKRRVILCSELCQEVIASLERWHDLSFIYETLEKQHLGDKNKLLGLTKFSEPDMHNIFKEALPEITVAERYILVKGLKKHAPALLPPTSTIESVGTV
jgi:hypothetical protein